MALEQISQAVLDTAQTEADHILKAAELAAAEKVRAGREAAEADGERRYQAATRTIEEDFARLLIQVKGAANKELLARKNAFVANIFDQARKRILSLPADQYGAVMLRRLENAAESHGGRIRFHAEDQVLFEGLLNGFNAGRDAALQVQIDASKPLSSRGGFVFVSEVFEVDQTLDTMLGDLARELAPQIASEAFAG
jgi:vacuolar-type H+-ATPase subunit E/Vma4